MRFFSFYGDFRDSFAIVVGLFSTGSRFEGFFKDFLGIYEDFQDSMGFMMGFFSPSSQF